MFFQVPCSDTPSPEPRGSELARSHSSRGRDLVGTWSGRKISKSKCLWIVVVSKMTNQGVKNYKRECQEQLSCPQQRSVLRGRARKKPASLYEVFSRRGRIGTEALLWLTAARSGSSPEERAKEEGRTLHEEEKTGCVGWRRKKSISLKT